MIALSILNGGPGPSFLSPAVVDFVFGGISIVKPQVEDVPDMLIREKIYQVSSYRDFITPCNTIGKSLRCEVSCM